MMEKVKYVKDIEILKPAYEKDLMAIKARGIAELKNPQMGKRHKDIRGGKLGY